LASDLGIEVACQLLGERRTPFGIAQKRVHDAGGGADQIYAVVMIKPMIFGREQCRNDLRRNLI
jgi:hypothetical protein